MKITIKGRHLLLLLMLMLFVSVLASCRNQNPPTPTPSDPVYKIECNRKIIILNVNETERLTASLYKDGKYENASVTYTSSAPDIIAVSGKGEVSALKSGEGVVTATAEGVSATCKVVVVDSGASAFLTLPEETLFVKVGDVAYASPEVRYNGKTYGGVTCTYELLDGFGTGSATISPAGVIIGGVKGTARVKITAKWGPFDGASDSNMVAYLDLHILHAITPTLADNGYQIYKTTTTLDGVDYIGECDLQYRVMWGENDITENPEVTLDWCVADSSVAEVVNGKLQGRGAGETELFFSYTYDGYTYESNKVKVFVKLPVVDKTSDTSYPTLIIEEATSLSGLTLFGEDKPVTLIESDGKFISREGNPSMIDPSLATMGKQTLAVYNSDYAFLVNAEICTKVIKTKSDFLSLMYTKAKQNEGVSVGLNKLYVLGNDIDFNGAEVGGGAWASNKDGFCGELNGRGHTISNFKVGPFGLFGTLGKGAYIHDLIIEDATVKGDYRSSLLAAGAYDATVKNLTVNRLTVIMPDFDEGTGRYSETGLLIARQTNASSSFINITVHAEGQVIPVLLGYELAAADFENFMVYAKEVKSYGCKGQCVAGAVDLTTLPDGITVVLDPQ